MRKEHFNIMDIVSPSFVNGGNMPVRFTCDGEDINPRLEIVDFPDNTAFLALVLEDPDHSGELWTHWSVWNILPDTPFIEEDSVPEGVVEGMTSFGECGYHGPCPFLSDHMYIFRAYALSERVDLPVNSTREQFDDAVAGITLEQKEISVFYPEKYQPEEEEQEI